MSRLRHKERADGGRLSSEPKWNAGGEQNAAKEAEERKKGGRVHHEAEGEHAKKRMDKRARGGPIALKKGGKAEHESKAEEHREYEKEKHHMHKGRARGGRIGANLAPLSTAARVKHVTKGEEPEEGGPEGHTVHNP